MAKKASKKPAVGKPMAAKPMRQGGNKNLAIAALLINLIIPGLGTIIGGNTKTGLIQLIVLIIGMLLKVFGIGFIIVAVAWVWALVTSIQALRRA